MSTKGDRLAQQGPEPSLRSPSARALKEGSGLLALPFSEVLCFRDPGRLVAHVSGPRPPRGHGGAAPWPCDSAAGAWDRPPASPWKPPGPQRCRHSAWALLVGAWVQLCLVILPQDSSWTCSPAPPCAPAPHALAAPVCAEALLGQPPLSLARVWERLLGLTY